MKIKRFNESLESNLKNGFIRTSRMIKIDKIFKNERYK